jgi:Asp-tRNA(Asn)/Glu-tRNA(Gln) amidotransferase A subunit family amidase
VVNPRQVREEGGVYGHKTTWGLISTRGHAPPGIMMPTDISVVGPMARHAEDLDLALRAAAGPDLLQRPAWWVELPPPTPTYLTSLIAPSMPLCALEPRSMMRLSPVPRHRTR